MFAPLLCGGLPHDKERALLRTASRARGSAAIPT